MQFFLRRTAKWEPKNFLLPLLIKSLLVFIVFLSFSGCTKEEEPFKSYLRMMLNGEKVECDYCVRASDYVPPYISQTQLLGIYGTWKYKKPQEGHIEIELYDFDNTPGTKSLPAPVLLD